MRERSSELRKWTCWLLATAALLVCALMVILLFRPQTPKPRVTFVGFANSAAGIPQAVYTIHNSGRGTLRRWDFYEYSLKDGRPPTEVHLGPDTLLGPGDSETVRVDIPSDTVAWRITFHFSDYAPIEAAAYDTDLPVAKRLAGSSVDSQMATDWITTPRQYRQNADPE